MAVSGTVPGGSSLVKKILASLQTDFPALYELITRSVQVQAIVDEIEPDGWSGAFRPAPRIR